MRGNSCRLVIAALRGGSGKTLISMGMIGAIRRRGYKVAPFKKGPDFIDASWLSAAGGDCHHLDTFLMSRERMLQSFAMNAHGSDIAIIEGNRGLFDGVDLEGSHSTAVLAELLRAPVVLVVDCTKVTRTVAAMILGCQQFSPRLQIKGVILNQIARARHEETISGAIKKYCGLPTLGAIPKLGNFPMPERHLGLIPPQENRLMEDVVRAAEEKIEKYVDLDAVLAIADTASPMLTQFDLSGAEGVKGAPIIGIIRDEAFQFYYPENIEALQLEGGRVVEINSLQESHLPDLDALYIGGGFPETHAEKLAANEDFRSSLREAVEDGLPVYGECGGAMFLGEGIVWQDRTYPMTGAYPVCFGWSKKPQAHGYTILETVKSNPFFRSETVFRGHEFHYSYVMNLDESMVDFAFKMQRGYGIDGERDGILYRNVLGTYSHIHALGSSEWARSIVAAAKNYSFSKRREALAAHCN